MKNKSILLAACLVASLGVVSCSSKNPASIYISSENDVHSLEVGQTLQLKAEVSPKGASQDVIWESGNVDIATINETGLDKLYNKIEELFKLNELDCENTEIITNNRHKQQILYALEDVAKGRESLETHMPVDITAICLKDILERLAEITGENVSEDIINEIFKKFCLGK